MNLPVACIRDRVGINTTNATTRFYRPELDVLRFVAFVLVFLHHTLPLAPGPVTGAVSNNVAHALYTFAWTCSDGLPLFFTLSAYLICELLLREREATGNVRAMQFYIRRILRIWPLYFLGLAITVVVALVPGGNHGAITWAAWAAVLMGNWYMVIHTAQAPLVSPMEPLWSISVEEQFYLFAPWVVKYFNRRYLASFAVALILLANICLYYLGRAHEMFNATWRVSFVQFENFAAGILLCVALRGRSPKLFMWARPAFVIACFACWCLATVEFGTVNDLGDARADSWSLMAAFALVAGGCCFLLVAILGMERSWLPGWAIYLGRISYGLYVYHGLAIYIVVHILPHHPALASATMLLKGAAAFGLTLMLASLSYRYFEVPFLRMKAQHEIIASRPI